MTDKKRVFMSFGGPGENYVIRVHQLCEKIKKTSGGFFDEIIPYTHQDLLTDQEFWKKHGDFCMKPINRRGFGYWLWKSYLIKKTLNGLNMGDFLVYTDAGCDFNPRGINRLKEYDSMLTENDFGLIAFQLQAGNEQIKYTKRILLDDFELTDQEKQTPLFMATVLVMKKTPVLEEYIDTWYDTACSNNYIYLTDSPRTNEYREFIDHRHDQSIHSILVKRSLNNESKNKPRPIVILDETWYREGEWETKGANIPFLAKRIRYPLPEDFLV